MTTGSTNYAKWGLSWSYDRYGNRLSQSATFDGPPTNSVSVDATTNRVNTTGYAYDANGNMTNDGSNTLAYDAENRVLSATNGGASGTYTYDGNNLRVQKVSGGTTTVYIFSGSKVIAEYVNGAAPASPTREYIYSGSALVATISGGTTNYHMGDHLSPRLTTDASGTVVGQQGHFPYGESWYSASSTTKWQFTSYERDAESGNDYAMTRSYVNRLARFSSPDPLAGWLNNPQSLSRSGYALNDPVNFVDPSGLRPIAVPYLPDPFVLRAWLFELFSNPLTMWVGANGDQHLWVKWNLSTALVELLGGPGENAEPPCIPIKSLNWLQRAQLTAARAYASLTGWTFGFGTGFDAGAGVGPRGSSWNFGVGGSGSTLIVADASGNSGILNSVSAGFAGVKTSSAGSWWGAGAAAGPSVLVSPFPISKIAGPSGSVSAGGGAVLGAGASVTTSGAATFTFGVGAGAEAGASPQFGTSKFIPFCKD